MTPPGLDTKYSAHLMPDLLVGDFPAIQGLPVAWSRPASPHLLRTTLRFSPLANVHTWTSFYLHFEDPACPSSAVRQVWPFRRRLSGALVSALASVLRSRRASSTGGCLSLSATWLRTTAVRHQPANSLRFRCSRVHYSHALFEAIASPKVHACNLVCLVAHPIGTRPARLLDKHCERRNRLVIAGLHSPVPVSVQGAVDQPHVPSSPSRYKTRSIQAGTWGLGVQLHSAECNAG